MVPSEKGGLWLVFKDNIMADIAVLLRDEMPGSFRRGPTEASSGH